MKTKTESLALLTIGLGIPVLVMLLNFVMPISSFDQISLLFASETVGLLCFWLFTVEFKTGNPQLVE
jgi:hypothetical protein